MDEEESPSPPEQATTENTTNPSNVICLRMERVVAGRARRSPAASCRTGGVFFASFKNGKAPANWTLFLKETGAVSGVSFGAEAVELPASVAVDHCSADLPASYALHLHEPGLYTIALAPGAALWAMLIKDEAGH